MRLAFCPAHALTVSSIIFSKGMETAFWICSWKKCAVLQGSTRKPQPARASICASRAISNSGESLLSPKINAVRSGMVAWLQTSIFRWSWSQEASVSSSTICSKYTVAIGPTPPRTPTNFGSTLHTP